MFYSSSGTEKAESVATILEARYGIKSISDPASIEPSIILALGGDGFMLNTLRTTIETQTPVYGINCGSVGFLLNKFHPDRLLEDIKNAKPYFLPTLKVDLFSENEAITGRAINDFYLLRSQAKAAKLCIIVDGKILTENFIGDGLIISTPAGSTAYNSAVGGPVLALDSNCIVMTAINSFLPREFKSLVLSKESTVEVKIYYADRRPVMAALDAQLFSNITRAIIRLDPKETVSALFTENENFHDKILAAQFHQ